MKKINIAIDGFSSCGKSTLAKGLAKKLNYIYVDTGAMYRALALHAYRKNLMSENSIDEKNIEQEIENIQISFKNIDGQQFTMLNGENVENQIRTLEIGNAASRISTIALVRKQLVLQQQKMATQKGIIMDGRDIGTVVLPNAELKIFLTASPEIRAERRFKELQQKGDAQTFEDVLSNIRERDHRDVNRTQSPLKMADDAIELNNSNLNIEQQLQWAIEKIEQII